MSKITEQDNTERAIMIDYIKEQFENMQETDKYHYYNTIISGLNYWDNYLYLMEEINMVFDAHDREPLDTLRQLDKNFNAWDDYFIVDVMGYYVSYKYVDDYADWQEIAELLIDNIDLFKNEDNLKTLYNDAQEAANNGG